MDHQPGPSRRKPPRTPDHLLTTDEIRAVTAFALACAEQVLPVFETAHPHDDRPRAALLSAAAFAAGQPRSRAQRVTAPAAHRAGRECSSPAAFHAATAAGDAAASAYLHPLADAAQVNHILRAAAHTVRVFELCPELRPGQDPMGCVLHRATPSLTAVLHRYPRVPAGRTPVARLVHTLDRQLRSTSTAPARPVPDRPSEEPSAGEPSAAASCAGEPADREPGEAPRRRP
ncbi:exonuclease SbcC [Streptomyces sp. P38-E01]|uniref:Exonuclease SbcC n=1 Tax=Streptomyces tardus TaxID=2780544 RepID=A0A949NB84_9ACTN|nr:exonuclease SbcC [Streptomyces tardus]MBU7600603.1 exonuclease SbcC [Streptomyces tardus]